MNNDSFIDDVPFTISVVGETTGQTLTGEFRAKKRLSHFDKLRRDSIRRELLGNISPETASPEALSLAVGLADLRVRLTKVASFWKEANDGLNLSDENVLIKIYETAIKIEDDARKQIQDAAKAASESLKQS